MERARWIRRLLALALALVAAGCSTTRPWTNPPLAAGAAEARPDARLRSRTLSDDRLAVTGIVTLSGGGARAAAFAYGVLQELQATPVQWQGRTTSLLGEVDIVGGVSGGSIAAAYYAAFGDAMFPRFETEFLRQDFQHSLVASALRPDHLVRLGSPWYGRSNLLAERLDRLYQGKTYGDLAADPHAPVLLVSATDLTLGTSFDFSAEQFSLICSDLAQVPLSFAVAASSSVPLLLSPMTLQNHARDCPQPAPPLEHLVGPHGVESALLQRQARSYLDGERRRFIHLVDGGLADNLGVRKLLDSVAANGGLLGSTRDSPPGSIHRIFLVAVNSERPPRHHIDASDRTPSMAQVFDALVFGAGSRGTRETLAMLQQAAQAWQAEARRAARDGGSALAADIEIHVITVNLADLEGDRDRAALLQVPTAFSIGGDEVTRLIEAGRHLLRASPEFAALKRSLDTPTADTLARR